jgi:3,4-dihydroxy 2-butanone 4-phosphate synthase / GTP cyclohydrolase II
MTIKFASIEEAIKEIKKGRMIIVVDDEDRENEGDLIMAAEYADIETINFMAKFGRGMICAPMTAERAKKLQLTPMVNKNTSTHETAFTITVDAAVGIATGISAADRAKTLRLLATDSAQANDFVRPGHIFPLIAKPQGTIERPGHTEAAVDLCKLAGLKDVGIICEIMNDDGSMARMEDLEQFGKTHNLITITIKDLIQYRQSRELNIELIEDIDFPNKYGNFRLAIFQHNWEDRQSIAIYTGEIKGANALTTRIHSQCFTGDIFGSFRCDCGDQLDQAMKQMADENKGLLIYLQQEGRGIGLVNKIKAYKLQESGLDTVEANLKLGFKAELRDYASAAQILRYYGIPSIKLLTNNPSKIDALKSLGYTQVERQTISGNINSHNEQYIMTKKSRMGHLINHNNLKQQ